jgi:putative dGTPase
MEFITGAYRSHDCERYLPEASKSAERTAFERDRARVLHSSGLRRLGAKTQVLGPTSDDFVRTRLTHSLEVAQVGRALAGEMGCDPDVVDTACLSHDLGHPAYGHNGEKALDIIAADIGGFEGNAQTLRLLTRLEPKVIAPDGRSLGLNLTRASLDATAKYPWAKGAGPGGEEGKSARKYCFYSDDADIAAWMRQGAPTFKRCIEAQIMDLSDDIAYSVHDVEDAISLGAMDPVGADKDSELEGLINSTLSWYHPDFSADELGQAWHRLRNSSYWLSSYDHSRLDQAALKTMSSQLIGRFVDATVLATRQCYGAGALTRYAADLVVSREIQAEIMILKGAAVRYVMAPREHEPTYLRQRTILFDLAQAMEEGGEKLLDPVFRADWRADTSDSARKRVIVDQLASLTDNSARAWHARYCGWFSQI